MKTFITVSLDKKDIKTSIDDEIAFNLELQQVVTASIGLMEAGRLVQLKVTNMPPRREDT